MGPCALSIDGMSISHGCLVGAETWAYIGMITFLCGNFSFIKFFGRGEGESSQQGNPFLVHVTHIKQQSQLEDCSTVKLLGGTSYDPPVKMILATG